MKRQKPIHFKVLWVVKLLGFNIRKIRNKDDIFEDLDKVDTTDLPSMYVPIFYCTVSFLICVSSMNKFIILSYYSFTD